MLWRELMMMNTKIWKRSTASAEYAHDQRHTTRDTRVREAHAIEKERER
jgi:hypothetical protein